MCSQVAIAIQNFVFLNCKSYKKLLKYVVLKNAEVKKPGIH